jgi:hypothetical protein
MQSAWLAPADWPTNTRIRRIARTCEIHACLGFIEFLRRTGKHLTKSVRMLSFGQEGTKRVIYTYSTHPVEENKLILWKENLNPVNVYELTLIS